MKFKLRHKLACLMSILIMKVSFSSPISDPCENLLSVVNRPTVADSACVVSDKKALLELGYQYQNSTGGGSSYNFPEAQFRLGLPYQNEAYLYLPNYNHQTASPHTGYNAPAVGFKHEIGYNEHWIGAVDGLLTLPSGSAAFGSNNYGATINGVVVYSFNADISLAFMLGIASQSQTRTEGGGRFTSLNPDLVLSWQWNEKSATYVEVFGQSKTAPGMGSGFSSDMGVLYLLTTRIETDIEIGQRISGALGGYNNYIGTGISFLI